MTGCLAAAILAGGRAQRFGADKSALTIDGE
jgi:molybdopterin-guanine dinucleotide biosynthesis protein A